MTLVSWSKNWCRRPLSRPTQRRDGLVVFGFEDVFERALNVELPGAGHRIRIPSPAGYAALKLRAWVDRSAFGEFKDADDMATIVHWYEHWSSVEVQLRTTALDVADRYFYDMPLACAHLLGRDIRHQLTPANATDLALRFRMSDTDRFASALSGEPGNPARRHDVARALAEGLHDEVGPA